MELTPQPAKTRTDRCGLSAYTPEWECFLCPRDKDNTDAKMQHKRFPKRSAISVWFRQGKYFDGCCVFELHLCRGCAIWLADRLYAKAETVMRRKRKLS